MSRRGRSSSRNNYSNNKSSSAYPYRNNDSRFSQHDNRYGNDNPSRDSESGEYYQNRSSRGDFKPRGGDRGKYRGGGYMGRRPRGRNGGRFSSWRGGGRGQHGRGRNNQYDGGPTKNSIDEDGDVDMSGTIVRPRPTPYDRPSRRPQNKPFVRQDRGEQRPMWNLLTVVQGATLDQDWLLHAIQQEAMVQILPVQYHFDNQNASFYIEDDATALTIRNCNKKISTPDGMRLTILKMHISPPISEEKIPILKKVLSDRYNTETLHLDSSALFIDQTLRKEKVEIRISQAYGMSILINIISEHIAGLTSLDLSDNRLKNLGSLKSLVQRTPCLKCLKLSKNFLHEIRELDYIKEWDLAELNLDNNPVCQKYNEKTEYISAVRDRFPNLMILDNQKLPPPVKFDLEGTTKLVPPKANHIPESVTEIIKEFVKQYFSLYDANRDDLVAAYHPDCMFSLCIPSTPQGPPLSVYFAHSRNLHRMKSSANKISFLKMSRLSVCALLKELPKTEHDLPGFSVDVPLATPSLLKFMIRGIFKEKNEGKKKNVCIRSFTRTFLCLTDGSRLSIINEQLFIRNATRSEMKSSFVKPPITPSPSPVPEVAVPSPVAPTKMDMIAAFCKESGMNANFSEQCLAEHGWDYNKAGQAFLILKEQGKIPPDAFVN